VEFSYYEARTRLTSPVPCSPAVCRAAESCARKFCAFGAECFVDADGRATCRCVAHCDVIVTSSRDVAAAAPSASGRSVGRRRTSPAAQLRDDPKSGRSGPAADDVIVTSS